MEPLTHERRPAGADLSVARIVEAAATIPSEFLNTPQFEDPLLNAALRRRVTVKVETVNPLRSFKGRGVGFALGDLTPGQAVVCSSVGNFGQAVAYIGAARGATVRIFAPRGVNPVKAARMRAFGADVVEVDGGLEAARQAAADSAEASGARLLVDGVDPGVAEGAATMARELTGAGAFDALVAPVGDGSLIAGLATWTRTQAPHTRVVGVNPASAPAMHDSLRAGRPVGVEPSSEFAEGISIPRPHPESLARVRGLVDDIVLVDDDEIRQAMGLLSTTLSLLVEPAGAAGVAAIAAGKIPGDRVATVLTGANLNPEAPVAAEAAEGARA